jgi:hypothetical protein
MFRVRACGIAALLMIAACGGTDSNKGVVAGNEDQEVAVILEGDPCKPVYPMPRIYLKPEENMTWRFENFCTTAQRVDLEFDASTGSPFQPGNLTTNAPAVHPNGKPGKGQIRLTVRPNNGETGHGQFMYVIKYNGNEADPVIIVEWN